MSVITEYVRLRPHELTELRRLLSEKPNDAYEYANDLRMGDEDEEVSSRGMDTDKAWAGLHHLLSKLGAPVDVIGGGEPMTEVEWATIPPVSSRPSRWPMRPVSCPTRLSHRSPGTMIRLS